MSPPPTVDVRILLEQARQLLIQGRVDEADRVAAKAEAGDLEGEDLQPLRLEVASRMADGYLRSGRVPFALGHLQQAVLLGAGAEVRDLFLSLLSQTRFPGPIPALKPILVRAFEEGWSEPTALGRLAARLLLLEPAVRALQPPPAAGADWAPDLETSAAREALNDPLLLALLDRALVVDPALEQVLVGVRRALLTEVGTRQLAARLQAFAVALANQAFATEYAYPVSPSETAALAPLLDRVKAALKGDMAPEAADLAIIATYRGLAALKADKRLLAQAWPQWLAPVLKRQLAEPAEEVRMKRRVRTLTAIEDAGSRAVKAQYEDNPFPRWVGAPRRHRVLTLAGWLEASFPHASPPRAPEPRQRHQVLVAGCGTGLETASLATMLPDVDILAVDLSRASLAFAMRKVDELGLGNVEFACADILQLASLERRFDLVVSAGVLHHLDDPLAGWRVLTELTRPGGAQLIALYSCQGRRHLDAARAFAAELGCDASPEGLRRYRAEVLALEPPPPWRADLLNRDDFYSLSMLRDLVFHVRETCFDVPRIGTSLDALGLRFAGFSPRPEVARRHQARFGAAADPLALDQWTAVEDEVPDAFWHMYHFMAERAA